MGLLQEAQQVNQKLSEALLKKTKVWYCTFMDAPCTFMVCTARLRNAHCTFMHICFQKSGQTVVALAPPSLPPLDPKATKCPVKDCEFEGIPKAVQIHYNKWHVGVTRHSCDQCQQSFMSRAGLRMHLLQHAGSSGEESLLECPDCDKKYKSKMALHYHREKDHAGANVEVSVAR